MTAGVELLDGVIRHYDWGSRTAIADLRGVPPSGEPEAELWLGAHSSAPALVGPSGVPLDEAIARDRDGALGSVVAERFRGLPFLVKVIAAAQPLSLQAHPSADQAAAGFARENAAGIPIDAPQRSFRDPHAKPELLCALSDFEALSGFRDPVATLDLLSTIDTAALDGVRDRLAADPTPEGTRGVLAWLLALDADTARRLVGSVAVACNRPGPAKGEAERATVRRLSVQHPDDAGVITSLLLNHVVLAPGEALFLAAGSLHLYLRGTAVEVMGNSDNVLRGGLTSKHVDVATLVEMVDPSPVVPRVQRPVAGNGVAAYDVPVEEFTVERVGLDGAMELPGGPAILLCVDGWADSGRHTLERGAAAWIPASDRQVDLVGKATIFRVGVGVLG